MRAGGKVQCPEVKCPAVQKVGTIDRWQRAKIQGVEGKGRGNVQCLAVHRVDEQRRREGEDGGGGDKGRGGVADGEQRARMRGGVGGKGRGGRCSVWQCTGWTSKEEQRVRLRGGVGVDGGGEVQCPVVHGVDE